MDQVADIPEVEPMEVEPASPPPAIENELVEEQMVVEPAPEYHDLAPVVVDNAEVAQENFQQRYYLSIEEMLYVARLLRNLEVENDPPPSPESSIGDLQMEEDDQNGFGGH